MRPAAPTRGALSRNHPFGPTGSTGTNGRLSAFDANACPGARRGDTTVPVRKTGSIFVACLRAAGAPARQPDVPLRAGASLPNTTPGAAAAAPAPAPAPAPTPAPALRALAGGRHTVGRA
jgi:hypothetical protein